jgi:hypothetical protein
MAPGGGGPHTRVAIAIDRVATTSVELEVRYPKLPVNLQVVGDHNVVGPNQAPE